jgi:hypothetical protein
LQIPAQEQVKRYNTFTKDYNHETLDYAPKGSIVRNGYVGRYGAENKSRILEPGTRFGPKGFLPALAPLGMIGQALNFQNDADANMRMFATGYRPEL